MPADETIEMAEAPPAKRKKGIEIPRWTKAVSLVFLVCLLLFGISRCAKGSSPDNANLAGVNPPAKQDVSRVGFGNDEYNRKIEEYAKERTDAANSCCERGCQGGDAEITGRHCNARRCTHTAETRAAARAT